MGRKPRHYEPDYCYFLTNRCANGQYLLTPDPELDDAIETLMAKYSTCHDVELVAWVFMGNHFHLIARSDRPDGIPDFMRDVQSELSDRVQDLRDGWNERVFPNRYSSQPILDDAMVREKIQYVWMNPVRAGLVRHPDDWPGASSIEVHRDGEVLERDYVNGRKLRRLRRKADDPDEVDPTRAMQTYELEVTNPPALADETVAEAGADLREGLDERCRRWAETMRAKRRDFAGAEQVRAQDPLGRPDEPPEAPEPLCLTSCEDKREAFRERYGTIVHEYRAAMEQWRDGDPDVRFPPGTFPPGWARAAEPGDFDVFDGTVADDGALPESDGPRGDPESATRAA